ncbi:hypothetical protein [uncultured Shimia sp.]|uniref:hypothetical protein n=1 Tax=uncultured Shimia sp. TaxID=573152 RepID=UPI0026316625|nr:hypothetical protein [uncultured Shimia sp.]
MGYSVWKNLAGGLALVLGASTAFAEGPPVGCYKRDYSDVHLAKHPTQVVDEISLRVYDDGHNNILADMFVTFADQGHVAGSWIAGKTTDQFLLCFDYEGRSGCAVECDGGNFFVSSETSDSLTIETSRLMVGPTDDCSGEIDLAEVPGQLVKYRLMKAEPGACRKLGE